VGGDFYDYIAGPDQVLTFFVGDVSGKGMPAALFMTMTRAILRAEIDSPVVPTPKPSSKVMLFVNAGHSAVIFRPVNGQPSLLDADGILLGIQEKSLSKNHRLCLAEGDLFVVTTDGLYEARNPRGKSFGIHRLLKQMQRLNGQSAKEIFDSLLRAISHFSDGESQANDQTVMVLRHTGQ
jgi:sigma-B regulation protein RsbU (phosphoserine phosphatase)